MRYGYAIYLSAVTVKANISCMMLATRIKTSTNFDTQSFDCFVKVKTFFGKFFPYCAANPLDDEIPNLQVSVPGHDVMSTIVPAPDSAKPTVRKS